MLGKYDEKLSSLVSKLTFHLKTIFTIAQNPNILPQSVRMHLQLKLLYKLYP